MSSSRVPKAGRTLSHVAVRCSLAVAAALAALLVHAVLQRILGTKFPSFMVFYPTIMVVALWAGRWPGLVATATSALLTDYFLLAPRYTLAIANAEEAVALALFAAIGVSICWVADGYRRSRERIAAHERDLAARQTEEKFGNLLAERARLLELSYDAIFARDGEDRITYWNQGAIEIYGYTREEALGRTPHELLKTELPQPLETIHEEARRRGRWTGDLVHTRKDGTKITVSSRWAVDLDAEGKIAAILETCSDITERKRAEASLRESEEQLRLFFEHTPVALAMFDREMRYLHSSWRWAEDYHLPGRDLRGLSHYELFPEISEEWKQAHLRGLAGEVVSAEADRFDRADGSAQWVRWEVRPWRDFRGDVGGIVIFAEDITQRIQTQQALQASEERFRSLIEQLSDAFFLHDDDGRFLEANREACESLGYTREELLGMGVFDVEVDVDQGAVRQAWEQAEPGKAYTLQARHKRRDGTVFPVEARLSPFHIGGEKLHLGLFRDITERLAVERKLREDKERIDMAMNVARAAEWEVDLTTGKAYQSERHANLFGYGSPQGDWSIKKFLQHVEPADRSLAREKLQECAATGSMDYEVRVRRADGEMRWLWLRGRLRTNEAGKPVSVFGTVQDVSERKQAEQELQKLNEELEDRVRERTAELEAMHKEASSFSYSVSHDLRSPLRTLAGFSQALLEDHAERLNEKGQHYLKRIQAAAQRMGDLIDALLSLSRLTRAEMEIKPADLSAIAQGVVNGLRDSDRGRDVEVRIEPGLNARGDSRLLHVALQNLLSNAWKFTARSEHAVIEVGKLNGRPSPTFFVRDNGAGFDMKYASQIFAPFQRLHSETEFAGTGIGLATVQRVILRHHGRIWAEASEGRGATFLL